MNRKMAKPVAAGLVMLLSLPAAIAADPAYRRCSEEGKGLNGAVQWYYVAGSFKPAEQSKLDAAQTMLSSFASEVVRSEKTVSSERRLLVVGESDKEKLREKAPELLTAGLVSNWIVACEAKPQATATLAKAAPAIPASTTARPPTNIPGRAAPEPIEATAPQMPEMPVEKVAATADTPIENLPLLAVQKEAGSVPLKRITEPAKTAESETVAPATTLVTQTDSLPVETLRDVVRKALNTNPEIALAVANRRATEEEVAEAKAFNLPVIDARIAGGPEQSKNASTIAAVNNSRNLTRQEAGLTLRQNLYDGGQISGEVERQKARLGAFASRETESRETTAFKVTDAYLEVLRNEDLLKLAEDNLRAHREILVKSKDRFTSGAGNKADFQLAEGRTALANATVVIRQGALQESRAKYRRVVSSLPAKLVKPDLIATLPISVEMASEMGVASNASVAALREELAAAKAASTNARSRMAPVVDVELAANNNRDIGGVPGPSNSASAMLVMRYNLFRGGGDDARIRQTVERETAATEALNNAKRAIEEEVSKAWHSMTAAKDAQRFYETHVQMTTEVLDSFRSQFDIGKRTMLDLMNSENELFQAKSTRTAGQYNLLLAQHRLLAGMGGLVATLGL